jgi:hypothetical protein
MAQSVNYCDVTSFPGTTDEKISSAIDCAKGTNHRTVYFPNGDYYLTNPITLNDVDVEINFLGESDEDTRLYSAPIIIEGSNNMSCLGPMFNFDISGGFERFFVSVKNFTLDFSLAIQNSIFTEGGCSNSGHGIRVGNGWQTGQLTLDRLRILYAPGYGIGIQNGNTGDIAADNLVMTNIFIYHSGMDGLDTKRSPDGGNSNLTILDMTVQEIGYNDESSAAALDISYDNFNVERVTIITEPTRQNPRGLSNNTGIRFRTRDTTAASNGTVQDFYIEGTHHAVFFEGKNPVFNENITLNNFLVKDFTGTGVYVRGKDHDIRDGCSLSEVGQRPWYIDPGNSIPESIYMNISDNSGSHCPAIDSLGSNYPDSIFTVIEENSDNFLPYNYRLHQNYPNPFNPRTIINYELPITNYVDLSIYNLLGQKVATLVNERKQGGYYQVEWDASQYSSGIYYYYLNTGNFQDVKKMILVK